MGFIIDIDNIYHNTWEASGKTHDIFEKFRTMCLKNYGLDPAHYVGTPGLSWDAMLRRTGVELELLTNADMYHFMEQGLKGGIASINKRYAKANNRYLPDEYNPDKAESYLIYLDANNLYGYAMSQYLPKSDFKFLSSEEVAIKFPLERLQEILQSLLDGSNGYILDVDMDYPAHLHDTHSDYPTVPKKISIDTNMYSPFMKQHYGKKTMTTIKLTPNLRNKKNYIVQMSNLALYLRLGMCVTKINKVISFKQEQWLKPYIDENTTRRAAATSTFEKDFFKLMNNAIYGKTCENLRKRIKLEFLYDDKKVKKRIAKPNFKHAQKINENITAVQCEHGTVTLNRPIYVGTSVLELSKNLMYRFHYDHMMQKYGNDALNLLFTDTDSLCYEIFTDDIYEDMKADASTHYDFSNYPRNHPLYNDENKQLIGYMKDELSGNPMREFVGLRPKCYSFLYDKPFNENEVLREDQDNVLEGMMRIQKSTAKAVKESIKEKHLRHKQYLQTLKNVVGDNEKNKNITVIQNAIVSKNHQLMSVQQTKIALSATDDKRWICDDGIKTYAYGRYKTL